MANRQYRSATLTISARMKRLKMASWPIEDHDQLVNSMQPPYKPSFAMCRAFPGSDHYEGSVTIGVSPLRPSRVPLTVGVGLATLQSVFLGALRWSIYFGLVGPFSLQVWA